MSKTSTEPTLRQLLRDHRETLGVTQAVLAGQVGLTGGMICSVEKGHRNLSRESTDRLATIFGLTSAEREQFYVAREVAAEHLSERKPKGRDASFALGLAQIDAELAGLDGSQEPSGVDRRGELYGERDRITDSVRETEAALLSRRLDKAEDKVTEFATNYDRLLKVALNRLALLEGEVERLFLDNEEAAFREAQRRASAVQDEPGRSN